MTSFSIFYGRRRRLAARNFVRGIALVLARVVPLRKLQIGHFVCRLLSNRAIISMCLRQVKASAP